MRRADIKVAAAAGLSVYLPFYWLATRPESDGTPNPLTADEVGVLLLTLAVYLLVPFIMGRASRHRLAAKIPWWLYVSVVGSAILVLAGVATIVFIMREPIVVEAPLIAWGVLTLWTMPAAAVVYYFRPVVDLIKAWNRGPDYETLDLRQ
jgi:hypothetical protein